MKKQERKETFASILNLMLKGENKEAYNTLACMCGEDTGLFILADYDKAMKELKQKVTFN